MSTFAALEDRVNAAVCALLTNRTVTLGALSFDAIFEDAGEPALDLMVDTTQPRLGAVPSDVAAQLPREALVAITHPVSGEVTQRTVVRKVPDGLGFTTLYLRD